MNGRNAPAMRQNPLARRAVPVVSRANLERRNPDMVDPRFRPPAAIRGRIVDVYA